MRIREWIGERLVYRFLGNFYSAGHDHIFAHISSIAPSNFQDRSIHDLGCGDGQNTQRVEQVFRARSVTACDHNRYLLERAERRGLRIQEVDLNLEMPRGEMATFIFSLHHLRNKEDVLRRVKESFELLFLCEPMNDLYHRLLDGGRVLSRDAWTELFDATLGQYRLYQYRNNLLIFFEHTCPEDASPQLSTQRGDQLG